MPLVSDLLYEKNQIFFALSETWLREHKDAEVDIPGYTLFRGDRVKFKRRYGRNSGGVAIYVRDDIAGTFECSLNFSNGAVEVLAIYSKPLELHIACVYRQPDNQANRSTSKAFKQAINKLHTSLSGIDNQNIIITGDFNLPHTDWSCGDIRKLPGASKDEQEMIETLNNLANTHFLNQIVKQPTHKDGNILDLILINNMELLHDLSVTEPLRSATHHYFLEVASSLSATHGNSQEEDEVDINIPPLRTLNFHSDDADWINMECKLDEVNWHDELRGLDPDQMVDKILQISYDTAEQHIPKRKAAKKQGTIPRDRKNLMRRRNRLNKIFSRATTAVRKEKIRTELIDIEKKLQKSRKDSRYFEEQKAIKAISKNSKYFFAYAKKFSKTKSSIGPLKDKQGNFVFRKREIAEILSQQYEAVFTQPTSVPCPDDHSLFSDNGMEHLKEITFTEEDFILAINELSLNAGSGPDGLPSILLKKCKRQYARALKILWQTCYDLGTTPSKLKLAYIIPMHKGESKSSAANYRPVALTSHIVKLFEKVVRTKIVKYMEENNKFNENQHGFRAGRSCLSELLAHYDDIINMLEAGVPVDTVYLDFSKAFDKVDHQRLLEKLSSTGIGGKLGRWIQSFLTQRKQTVLVNKTFSNEVDVVSGVPQGSVLGPLLFIIMINDIDSTIINSKVRSFADDTRATKGVTNVREASELQSDLEEIYDWANINRMSFNDTKFEAMRYRLKQNPIQDFTSYTDSSGRVIQEKEHIRDLGVTMSNDTSFKAHVKKTTESVRNLAGWILRTFRTRDKQTLLTAWKTLVLPIHDYCSQLWSPFRISEISELEAIQWNFIRKIRCTRLDDYWDALNKLGLYSLERRRDRYRVIYLWKSLEGMVPSLGLQSKWNPRRGRIVDAVKISKDAPAWVQQAKLHSFKHQAVQIWNLLPKYIRDTTNVSVDTFKSKLDRYLQTIPDQPRIPSMTSQCLTTSNCLQSFIPFSEAERIRSGNRHIDAENDHNQGGATQTSLH